MTRSELDLVAIDLETTGLFASSDRIIEIGACRFAPSGDEVDRFVRRVNPERPVSPSSLRVHGIDDDTLQAESPASVVLPEFLAWLGNPPPRALLAHNAVFDAGFLGRELARLGIAFPKLNMIDTLPLARHARPDALNHQLDTLAHLLGFDASSPHSALADAVRVKDLWLTLRGDHSDAGVVSFPIFDPDTTRPAPNGWGDLEAAIDAGQRVRIAYSGGSRGMKPREVSPKRFEHHGGVAYVVAVCHLDGFEKSFRLDRVLKLEVIGREVPP